MLLSLDQKYNNEWDKLSKDEQTAGRRRHFEIWRKYQCFDYATHDLPSNANAMDMTWVDKTEAEPEKPGIKEAWQIEVHSARIPRPREAPPPHGQSDGRSACRLAAPSV